MIDVLMVQSSNQSRVVTVVGAHLSSFLNGVEGGGRPVTRRILPVGAY